MERPYLVRKYSVDDTNDEVIITEYTSSTIEFALKLWTLEWCKEPYMCELLGSKSQILDILNWVIKHRREFYLIGTNTTCDAQKCMFEVSLDKIIKEISKSLKNKDIMHVEDDYFTARPFNMGE